MPKCNQCDKPAVVDYNGNPLCVEHYTMMIKATHSILSWQAANLNRLRGELEAEAGGFVKLPQIDIPQNPFMGGNLTLNNISINQSTIGALNTGTIANLDAGITIMNSQGEKGLAQSIKELTEAVINSNEINEQLKNEINEQLEFLVAQATSEPKNRSMGTIKSVLFGLQNSISTVAGLLTIWNSTAPLIKAAFGIS
jgi:hypothetical protein